MSHRRTPTGPWLVMLAVMAALGCSGKDRWQKGRPPVVKAAGIITHDGKPLADAVITFHPKNGQHSAFDRSDANGNFELTTFDSSDGAVAGEYDVQVTRLVVENDPDPRDPEHLPPLHHAEYSIIPEHYYDTVKSGLTATIPESGTDKLVLELTGKPAGKFDKGTPKYRK